MNKPSRLQIALYLFFVLAMVLLALRDWSNYTVGFFLDDGIYVVLSESLAQSPSYGWYFMPEPLRWTQFPFGLPLLLAPLSALLPGQYDVLRFVPLGASVLSVSLLFWGWRTLARGFSYWWGLALVALFALSPLTILFARVVLSEAPFLAWCLVAILFTERLATRAGRWDAIWLGLSLLGLVYTRTIGWVFLGALVVYLYIQLRNRAWRPLVLAAISFVATLLVLVSVTSVGLRDLVPTQYAQELWKLVFNRTASSLSIAGTSPDWSPSWTSLWVHLDFADWLPAQIQGEINALLLATGLGGLRILPGILLLGLVAYGGYLWFRQSRLTAFWLVMPVYLVSLLFWTWEGSRFFYPVQPQVLFALMLSAYGILSWAAHFFSNDALARGLAAGFLLVVLTLGLLFMDLRSGTWFFPRETRGADMEWISQETPTDSVLLTNRPATYHLYVRRTFIPLPAQFRDTGDLLRQIRTFEVDYVITPAGDYPFPNDRSTRGDNRARFLRLTSQLVERGVLVPRYSFPRGDAQIFQVDRTRLALEPE